MSDRPSLFRVRSLASRPFTRAESLGMMRYSMPVERVVDRPIRIVGGQRDTNIELVVDELVRTASNRGCGPPLPRARRHEGALTDDLRSPSSQTLLEERVAALGMHNEGKRINAVLANTLAATAPAMACRHVSSIWVITPLRSTSISYGCHAREFLDQH